MDQAICRICRQAEAAACSVTLRPLHGPGSNFCHPPAHGEYYSNEMSYDLSLLTEELVLIFFTDQ